MYKMPFFFLSVNSQGILSNREQVKSLSCVRLCDPVDCSLPGSSVHGIFQARILEGVAIAFSRAIEIDKWINTLLVGIFVCGDITEP